eukprot:scaffold111055_cov52-Attheya_sp.AAC.3
MTQLGAYRYNNSDFPFSYLLLIYAIPDLKLSLTENVLTGTLPTELGNMADLNALEIHSNFLSQTIPTEIGNMKNLTLLDVTGNMLSGGVPPQVCQLRQGSLKALSVDCAWRLTCPESCCTLCL